MSYCRFSSNDFLCDVYVYQSQDGWEVHVAGNRIVYKEPLPDRVEFSSENTSAFIQRMHKVSAMYDEADRVDISLPHAGESFTEGSPGECADRLEYLRGLGYNVPQHAIEALREEAEEAE